VIVEAFALIVPVKALSAAKTRLALDGDSTRTLMRAFAADALAAAAQSPLVAGLYVVSNEPDLELPEATVLPDDGDGDLNRALTQAARRVRTSQPNLGLAALCADLPCLVEPDLTRALSARLAPRWFVADAEGGGTTLLATVPGVELEPCFGPGSAARHAATGAAPVGDDVPTLRLDVDTTADLDAAVALGVGRHTAAALSLSARG
jgi:2-phospho-L-lactate guanylyltransferase